MTKHEQSAPLGERRVLGMPFDFSRPTVERIRRNMWNADDRRLFTAKTFGWGWGINLYWLVHPAAYVSARRNA